MRIHPTVAASLLVLSLFVAARQPVGASPIQVQITGMTGTSAFPAGSAAVPYLLSISYDPNNLTSTTMTQAGPTYNLGQNSSVSLEVGGATVFSQNQNVNVSFMQTLAPSSGGSSAPPTMAQVEVYLGPTDPSSTRLVLNLSNLSNYIVPPNTEALTLPMIQNDFSSGSFELLVPTNIGSQITSTGTIGGLSVVPEPLSSTIFCILGGGLLLRRLRKTGGTGGNPPVSLT